MARTTQEWLDLELASAMDELPENVEARVRAAGFALPRKEPVVKKKYHVSRDVTYMEVTDVEADSMAAAVKMVEQDAARIKPRVIRLRATRHVAREAS